MKKYQFYAEIEEILEIPPNTLKGAELLQSLENWDSLAVMGFIAMVDKNFNFTLEAKKISRCQTVDELYNLLGDRTNSE